MPWLWSVDHTLAFVNEPPPGRSTNVEVGRGNSKLDLPFIATRVSLWCWYCRLCHVRTDPSAQLLSCRAVLDLCPSLPRCEAHAVSTARSAAPLVRAAGSTRPAAGMHRRCGANARQQPASVCQSCAGPPDKGCGPYLPAVTALSMQAMVAELYAHHPPLSGSSLLALAVGPCFTHLT